MNAFDLQVEQRRGLTFGSGSGYRLILRHVSELGWTNSKVTKYRFDSDNYISKQIKFVLLTFVVHFTLKSIFIHRTDFENNRIIYTQDFPEKSLNGEYEFKALVFGRPYVTKGIWNMTLYDYAWVKPNEWMERVVYLNMRFQFLAKQQVSLESVVQVVCWKYVWKSINWAIWNLKYPIYLVDAKL